MVIRLLLGMVLRLYNIIVYGFKVYGFPTIIPLDWNFRFWNYRNWKSKYSNLIEWNYHTIFSDEIIGSYGLFVINPNKLPLIPHGTIFIVYGLFKKTQKPFTLFRLIPTSPMTDNKSWPFSTENPMEFYYKSEKSCRIKITNTDWSVDLEINNDDNRLNTSLINDNNTGPLSQHWTVTNPWKPLTTNVTGTLSYNKVGGTDLNPHPVKGLSYFENSGGCTFMLNLSWFFLICSAENFSFSFQSYYRSSALTQLFLFHDKDEITFDHTQIKIYDIDETIHNLRNYSQLGPKSCALLAKNSTHKIELNFVVEHNIEAEKHDPGEKTKILFKYFFIMFLVGKFSGTLTCLESDKILMKFDDHEFCGEYAKHNLFLEPVSNTFLPG